MSEPASPLRRIRAIVQQRSDLEAELAQAMEDAREAGSTWGEIGISLGLGSRSGARQWFVRYQQRAANVQQD